MPTRIQTFSDRSITPNGAAPVVVPTNASTDIIPDQTVNPKNQEIAARSIQNVGANVLYYAFGQNASTANYHGILAVNGTLDCSAHRLRVSGFSAGGTTVAVTILYRNDNTRNTSSATPLV